MFFHIPIERELLLHPRLLGPHVTEHLKEKLLQTVEGSCSGRHGYIISVTEITSQSKGQIKEGTGITSFTMKFNAIVFRPFKARPRPSLARAARVRRARVGVAGRGGDAWRVLDARAPSDAPLHAPPLAAARGRLPRPRAPPPRCAPLLFPGAGS